MEFVQMKSKVCDALIVLKETDVGSQVVVGLQHRSLSSWQNHWTENQDS